MDRNTPRKIKILNDLSVVINNEGHTMMNPLRWIISNNWKGEEVEFCGYTIPHPSVEEVHVTVQFSDERKQSPEAVLEKIMEALDCLDKCTDEMMIELDKSLEMRNKAGIQGE